ncbi:MAG: TolC family protein [Deltaproteobacteria bacterium]|nr:TolC family protein [Deltaproteobacteria bacterium]
MLLGAFLGVSEPARADTSTASRTLTLEEALGRARSLSKELKLARERIVIAEANLRRAWALLKPRWDASFTYTHTEPPPPPFEIPAMPDLRGAVGIPACQRTDPNDPASIADPTACTLSILGAIVDSGEQPPLSIDFLRPDAALFRTGVQWSIFNGRALPALANAQDTIDLEGDRFRAHERAFLLGVARAYYGAAAASDAVDVAVRGAERSKSRLAVSEQKAGVGELSSAVLRLERISARQAEIDLARAVVARRQALSALAYAIGDTEPITAVVPPPPPQAPEDSADVLAQRALDQRDDVRAARLGVAVAERAYAEVWWRFAPTISLFGNYRYTNVVGFGAGNDEWAVGVAASMLLYDGGLRYADLAEADSAIRSAHLSLERLEETVRQEISRAQLRLDAAALALDRAEEVLGLAEERSALTRTQYEAGAAREIELQEALDDVRTAEVGVVSARFERDVAILELQQAAGLFQP